MIDPTQLINQGVLGIVLAWFMFRMESRMKQNTTAFNELVLYLKTNGKNKRR